MERLFGLLPIKAAVVVPLIFLRELAAHEKQLLTRTGEHESEISPKVREFLPAVSRHFGEQRAFAMHDLIMGERKHEVLVERIEHAERQAVVMVFPMDRILRHVSQRVVHPAHVPLVAKSQTAEMGGARNHRPCGRFLRNRHSARIFAIDHRVERAQEIYCLQVLGAAVNIRNPLAFLAAVIPIEHGSHGIHAQAVYAEFRKPEQRVRQQIAAHLAPPEVENERVPVRVKALSQVLMFIEMRTVKPAEPMCVAREMSGGPIQNHADAFVVAASDESMEFGWRTIAARGRE